jgi:RNA polymerase sigma-70 factor (ECF subfamily)
MSGSGQDDRGREWSAAAERDTASWLVPGSAGGCDAEFTVFYMKWTKPLVGFLVMQGADIGLAADLVQETMAVLYRRWLQVDHPRAWAFRAASRRLVRVVSAVREIPTDDQLLPQSPLLRFGAPDIEHWEQRHDLIDLIKRLPSRQRQVMAWTLYDHTPAEIAEQLGLSVDTVRSNLYHARNTLKDRFAGEEDQ